MVEEYYINRAVAFIDILGFSELVRRTEYDMDFAKKLEGCLQKIKSFGGKNAGLTSVTTFSDSIVISIPLDKKPGMVVLEPFMTLFGIVCDLTNVLLQQGIIIRGAISVGKLYHEADVLFGPAMLDAVGLEKKALFPRITIVEESFQFPSDQLNNNQHLPVDSPLRNLVGFLGHHTYCLRDEDGKLFINFLGTADKINSPNWERPKNPDKYFSHVRGIILEGHKHCSQEKSETVKKKNQDKWRWLASYFNRIIKEKGLDKLYILDKHLG